MDRIRGRPPQRVEGSGATVSTECLVKQFLLSTVQTSTQRTPGGHPGDGGYGWWKLRKVIWVPHPSGLLSWATERATCREKTVNSSTP